MAPPMAPLPFFPIQLCHLREHASGDQWCSSVPSNNRECLHSSGMNRKSSSQNRSNALSASLYDSHHRRGRENMEFTLPSSQIPSDHMWLFLPMHWRGIIPGSALSLREAGKGSGAMGLGWTSLPCYKLLSVCFVFFQLLPWEFLRYT